MTKQLMKRATNGLILLIGMLLLTACYTVSDNGNQKKKIPNLTAAKYNVQLGLAYLQQGKPPRAKQKLLLALKQGPKWPEAYEAMAYYLEMTGSPKESNAYYKRAIELSDSSGNSLNNYGAFLCRRGRYQAAEKYFLAAVKDNNYLEPAGAYENAGLCAMGIPDNKKAIAYFRKALQKDPRRITSMIESAEIYYKQKKYNLSRNYLKNFLAYASPNAQSLWLGIRLAKKSGDRITLAREAKLLKTRFAQSAEYQQYKKHYLRK